MPSSASERTPLLRSTSANHPVTEDAITTAEVAQQGQGAAHQFPTSQKARTGSLTESVDPGDVPPITDETESLTKFQKNGKLEGIGEWKFRFVFGGILLGYFPLMGRLSDTLGRRPLYLAGLVVLAATTAWCSFAQTIGSFIAARAFCGIGAAGVLSMGNIMTNDLVSIEVRGTYQAYINLFYGGGSACGAAFGGFLCDKLGWRMTFAIQIPILVMLFINAIFTTPSSLGPNLAKRYGLGLKEGLKGFDIAGSILLTVSVAFLILGLNLGGNIYPWKHWIVITSLVIALVTGAVLVKVESRAARAVMPLPMLFSKPRGNLVFNNFFAQVGMNTILFNAPLYFQAVELETASVSGFRLAGPSVALTICGVSAGFIMTATGRMKWLIVVGSLSMLLGATCLSLMWDGIPKWLATIFLVPSSIGQGLSFPATSLAVLATSTQEDQAVMTSTLILWRSLGIVMGVSLSSLILQNALTSYLEALVTGYNKAKIIQHVRKSVRSIIDLDAKHKSQVIEAYSRSLRLVFISAIAMFIIVNILVFAIELPQLKKSKVHDEEEEEST
ncbi:hypothetical protein J4E85_000757 [Alternaria conjuncta]|uniref:uncharacterized protein n=1 Tax=Alternaria conjuncta TaxID=181017 RepID=UPI00221EAF06|nr:uncharacterized protein J4E85_000757 [Alternaria conjuncta]KAI4938317.1 hypothetical protein J4E85_000757 [Alternaria conjuncta]